MSEKLHNNEPTTEVIEIDYKKTKGEQWTPIKRRGKYLHVTPPEGYEVKGRMMVGPAFGTYAIPGLLKGSANKKLAVELAKKGYEVFFHEHPERFFEKDKVQIKRELALAKENALKYWTDKGYSPNEIKHILKAIDLNTFRESFAYRNMVLHANPDNDLKEMSILGHSHGGLYVPIAAFLWHDSFKDVPVILLNPAGRTGKEDKKYKEVVTSRKIAERLKIALLQRFKTGSDHTRALSILIRYTSEVFRSSYRPIREEGLKKGFPTGARFFVENLFYTTERWSFLPGKRALNEGSGMANTDARLFIEKLVSAGNKVTTIYDDDDIIFPGRIIDQRLGDGRFGKFIKTHNETHYGVVHDPKRFSRIIDSALEN